MKEHLAPVLLALAGTMLSSLCGFAAGPVLLLVTVAGAFCFATLGGRHRISLAAVFGASLLLLNMLLENRSVFDKEVYTLLLPILVGVPVMVAVLAKRFTSR